MTSFKEIATDALRYWERRRLIYNAVLALVTVAGFLSLMPRSLHTMDWRAVSAFFVLAVAANVLYCAAYIPEVLAQFSGFREQWRKWRWILFVVGTLFGALLAVPIVLVCFAAPFSH